MNFNHFIMDATEPNQAYIYYGKRVQLASTSF